MKLHEGLEAVAGWCTRLTHGMVSRRGMRYARSPLVGIHGGVIPA